jgi:hypothetical protein
LRQKARFPFAYQQRLVLSFFRPRSMSIILETTVRGIAIYGDSYAVNYVYVPGRGSGGQCYSAYVVEHDSGEILAYHCR